jgi:hypothetical protein
MRISRGPVVLHDRRWCGIDFDVRCTPDAQNETTDTVQQDAAEKLGLRGTRDAVDAVGGMQCKKRHLM